VFISGLVFLLLNLTKIREYLINSLPDSLKLGISAGIGLFIAFIGFKEAGLIVGSPSTLLTLGPVTKPPVVLAMAGFAITATLFARKVSGAILWGMLFASAGSWILGLTEVHSIFSMPPSLKPTLFQLDLNGLFTWHAFSIMLIFLFMTVFDTLGTLVGVGVQAGLLKDGKLPRASRALLSDAVATTVGACLGTSTVSSYIESSTGVAHGGRTGLTAVTVGVLFLLALFFSPLVEAFSFAVNLDAKTVIHPVTAPALIMVGSLMMCSVSHIKWDDITEALPTFLIIALIPLSFNIADGIAAGFIAYPLLKAAAGKAKEASLLCWALAAIFILRYVFL